MMALTVADYAQWVGTSQEQERLAARFVTVGYKGIGGNTSLENPGHLAEVQCSAGKYSAISPVCRAQ